MWACASTTWVREDEGRRRKRRGMVLPVVLLMLLLLGLMAGTFTFHVQADYSAGFAMSDRLQTRLAAEAGIQKVMYMLRTDWSDVGAWYHNPEVFDQGLVWRPGAEIDDIGKAELIEDRQGGVAYRFSIVADNPFDDESEVRYGITDEASKLNINTATQGQLLRLIAPLVDEGFEPLELVHALLDWRDADDTVREFGAEAAYYRSLPVPYRPKNALFETVEELLLVKGFTGLILHGEDQDRNGLLTPNEDDGEISFPLDNEDGVLERGLLPYITVYSQEYNVANDNKPRINLFGDPAKVREDLEEVFDDPDVIDYLINSTKREGTDAIQSLADYLEAHIINNTLTPSPVRGNDVATLFDKCTIESAPEFQGRINIVTAPPRVLRCIENLAPEKIALILQKRVAVAQPMKSTTGWLVAEKILSAVEYRSIRHQITARSRQFTIESIGFADHTGVFTRLQAVVNMRGPLAQIIYNRDITKLGLAYPIRGEQGDRDLVIRDE